MYPEALATRVVGLPEAWGEPVRTLGIRGGVSRGHLREGGRGKLWTLPRLWCLVSVNARRLKSNGNAP